MDLSQPTALTPEQERLRDQHAKPILAAIRRDAKNAPTELQPLFAAIAEHLVANDFDVSQLMRLCGVKRRTAMRKAFARTVLPPSDYIRLHRCALAAALLAHTKMPIWAIGKAVGHTDTEGAALRRAFRSVCGRIPSAYREQPDDTPFAAIFAAGEGELVAKATESEAAESADPETPHAAGGPVTALRCRIREQAPIFAAALHRRGSERAVAGDLDLAYRDFDLARRCDDVAGMEAPSGHLRGLMRCDTDALLADDLCPDCRRSFNGDVGHDLRQHLRQALALVPRSLSWFDPQYSCDDCYRLIWNAISRARFGRLPDAFQAWWLSRSAHLGDDAAPSIGLFILLLAESQKLAHREPRRCLEMCRRAGDVARELDAPDLLDLARIYEADTLRALSRFQDARDVFDAVETRSCLWLEATYLRGRGTLDTDAQDLEPAVRQLRRAAELFQEMDPHEAGLSRLKLTEALRSQEEIDDALATFEDLLTKLDLRRWPGGRESLPIDHALHLMAAGQYDRAGQCLADAFGTPLSKPSLHGAVGELKLGKGDFNTACLLLQSAVSDMLDLEKYDDAVILTLCLAEARAGSGSIDLAIETAMTALTYNGSSGRVKQALQALDQLLGYSGTAARLAEILREISWRSGGALAPKNRG